MANGQSRVGIGSFLEELNKTVGENQEPKESLLEVILKPKYEIPGLSAYSRAVGRLSEILDAPIEKEREQFAEKYGISKEDVPSAVGGTSLGMILGQPALSSIQITPGDIPPMLAPASGDPETGEYSPLDIGFAIADVASLGATKPIKKIGRKILDDFSAIAEHAKIRKVEKQIAKIEADAPGTLASGEEPDVPWEPIEMQEAEIDALEGWDTVEGSSPDPEIMDLTSDAPSPAQALPEGTKVTPGGTAYRSTGLDEFDEIEKTVMSASEQGDFTVKGFIEVDDGKNFNPGNLEKGDVAILRVRKSEGRVPLKGPDRDVIIMKTSEYAFESLGQRKSRFMLRTLAPEGEAVGDYADIGMSRLDWSVARDPSGKNVIDSISFFGKQPKQALTKEAIEKIEAPIRALQKSGEIDVIRAHEMISEKVRRIGEMRLGRFHGSSAHDFITFLPDNWRIVEESLTFDSFMLLLNTAVKRKAEIIFDPTTLQYVSGGSRSHWYKKAGTALLDAEGNFRRAGVDEVIDDAMKVLSTHKHPERISSSTEEIFRQITDPDKGIIGRYRRARVDPKLKLKLEQQHGIARAREIMEDVEKGYEPFGESALKGQKGIEFGQMTIKQIKSVVAGLMGFGGSKEFDEFMNYNPESMEAQVFDNEQLF